MVGRIHLQDWEFAAGKQKSDQKGVVEVDVVADFQVGPRLS